MSGLNYIVTCIFCLLLIACDPVNDNHNDRVVNGTGPIVSQILNVSSFERIENAGVANIYVSIGSPQFVRLKAQQNIIDVLTYEVIDNTFKIGIEKNISIGQSEDIIFEIVVSKLSDISIFGVGSYELEGDFQDDLTISLIGVGDVHAYEMEVGTCTILSTGVGNCWVNVRDELNITLTGVGNVYYRGIPAINQNVSGAGNIINDN